MNIDFKKIYDAFKWKPKDEYNFILPYNSLEYNPTQQVAEKDLNFPKDVMTSISDNLTYLKSRFNSLINTDIEFREFNVYIRDKQYNAFLLFIDGMVNSDLINNYILKPLMLKNKSNSFSNNENRVLYETTNKNVTIRKLKKLNIENYILNCLLPQNTVKKETEFNNLISGINSGNCALFIDTLNVAFDIDVKGTKQRSVESPNNEIVIKGPHEAFVENIRNNTALIRKIVNNEDLIIENVDVGDITKTKCAICYVKDIANNDLVNEVRYRINGLEIDSVLSSGQLEQLITEDGSFGIPEVLSTERPDKACKYLLEGRVIVLLNGSPYSLIMPATIIDFLASPEDSNLNYYFANFLRIIRFLSAFLTLLLPGLYIAITCFHQEILPTELLFSILASRQNVPFPVIVELLTMEISFEIIREAGLRVPSPIGPTIGIVGALVLGQAAVSAGIVSPVLIIIVAITGIASFAIPDFSFGFHLRLFRFVFVFLGYISGFLGISVGLFVYLCKLCELKSFGVSFTSPYAPLINSKGNGYLLDPMWKREYRSPYIDPKKPMSQEHISMKWKFK